MNYDLLNVFYWGRGVPEQFRSWSLKRMLCLLDKSTVAATIILANRMTKETKGKRQTDKQNWSKARGGTSTQSKD